jgi:signal transduction histidine kinase
VSSPALDWEERLLLLAEASQTLLENGGAGDPLPAILDLSRRLLSADAYAVWRCDPGTGDWRVVADVALSASFPKRITGEAVRALPPDRQERLQGPIVVEDVREEPMLAGRREVYEREQVQSLLAIPFGADDNRSGTVTFYYQEPHRFSPAEVRLATALANLAAVAIATSELHREGERIRAAEERGRQRLAFLAEASAVLDSSLDYETTLEHVARLVVPHLADWCTVHLKDETGSVRQVAVAHLDPEKVTWSQAVHQRYPYDPDTLRGVPNVIRTGQSELYPDLPEELLAATARDEEHLRILKQLNLCSCMVVPMAIRDRVFGAISFYAAESGVHYDAEDLALAERLADRAATAIENARLYRETERTLAALIEQERRKDAFLAMLGHELRNPMGAIRNAVQVIDRLGTVEPRLSRAVAIVRRQCGELARLVEDLLDVSRLRRGRLAVTPARIDMVAVVRTAVELHAPGPEGPRLTVTLSAEPVWVNGDRVRLTQVLTHLLDNAIKFTEAGGMITVSLERIGEWAEVTVHDTGLGIPPEMLPQLFEPFAQVEEIRARSLGGLGLGLPLVKGILALHGGEIRAESAGRGKGATFHFRLPAVE